jgi:hypothetical protein
MSMVPTGLSRTATLPTAAIAMAMVLTTPSARASAADVKAIFDVPDKIECRDVTPRKCAAAYPDVKVIEGTIRISASLVQGTEDSVIDFTYMISSPEMRLKILDYLPNTILESRYADDRIEVTDRLENTDATNLEALAGYSIFSLSATRSQVNRRTESNQYERIAPKALVLASGTMNRGHGVFYKLRRSNTASLEGAKEFTFLARVPKDWRGDWCTVVCTSRANKRTLLGNSVVSAGAARVDVGLHLAGDKEAADLCIELCRAQQEDGGRLKKRWCEQAATCVEPDTPVTQAGFWSERVDALVQQVAKKTQLTRSDDADLEAACRAVRLIEEQLAGLSGTR